jgi:putative membrane protein
VKTITLLATNNAALNAASGVCLTLGLRALRAGDRAQHRRWMLSALGASALFLVSYLTRVLLYGSVPFRGTGLLRALYLTVLGSHMVLAVVVVPVALRVLWLSERAQRYEEHKRLARVLFPVWMYVSVTGVLVYLLLFHFPV